jgi:signal transduction histidine kinase
VTLKWSKRAGLHAGYGSVIAVLVLSAIEAYHIQIGVSRQHLEIYRHFVEQDEALATLRRNVWLVGNRARDFFIDSTPAQGELLHAQLSESRAENEAALRSLSTHPGHRSVVPQLQKSLDEFWDVLDPLPRTMAHPTARQAMEFLQREVVPRRGELYNALRELTFADQRTLQDSEGEFAAARRRAAERLLVMLSLGVLLSVLVASLSIRHAENLEHKAERHYAEVEEARHELQQLSARLLEIEEEGRRRLSRELHDEIGQTLALLQIEISHVVALATGTPAALRTRLDRARDLAERTVLAIRSISLLLRPALLDDLGLVPALQFQLEEFLRRSGVPCDFTEEGVADQLPDAAKTCVYRVVQEALHNCEKHAGATKVEVFVRQFPDRLVAEVSDNGGGFSIDPNGRPARSFGLGLLGSRERAANAGGSLTIDSAPGRGTRVTLIVPLAQPIRPLAETVKEVNA